MHSILLPVSVICGKYSFSFMLLMQGYFFFFYGVSTIVSHMLLLLGVINDSFTPFDYQLWSRRVQLHMAYFCKFMVNFCESASVW